MSRLEARGAVFRGWVVGRYPPFRVRTKDSGLGESGVDFSRSLVLALAGEAFIRLLDGRYRAEKYGISPPGQFSNCGGEVNILPQSPR
jgi:hypothetical protein